MTKSELIAKIASKYPTLYLSDIEKIVFTIINTVTENIAKGNRVELRGFGSFDEAFKLAADNEILVGAVRWKLFPFLAFNVRAQKNFSTAKYGQGVDGAIREAEIAGGFQNSWDYGVDCQIGAHY